MSRAQSCFKAYDIRGPYPLPLGPDLAWAIGRAAGEMFAESGRPLRAAIGRDVRLSSPALARALASGLEHAGAQIESLGLCGTEEVYFALASKPYDLGIMVTGSHNPADENGFKLVRRGAVPISGDSGLKELAARALALLEEAPEQSRCSNTVEECAIFAQSQGEPPERGAYIKKLLALSGISEAKKPAARLKVLADCGNGCAGPVLERFMPYLPFADFVCEKRKPDGNFPKGVPNPLLPERRAHTAEAVRRSGADLGLAWDGDFDRCFFYDSEGNFIEGYYLVGLFAEDLLKRNPGQKIIHDTRVYWNTRELVLASGGIPLMGKTGHAFMKERLRAENALYGGEMSAHHYFRDFAYCDSGMLPMLLLLARLANTGESLAELVNSRIAAYPCSGEINRRVEDAPALLAALWQGYAPKAIAADQVDGINLEFSEWRFNLRSSNTEPLLRLNVESRANPALLEDKCAELLAQIGDSAGAIG